MEERIAQLKADAQKALNGAVENLADLDSIRVHYLGKKGEITSLLRSMKDVAKEDRPAIGKIVNEARSQLEDLIAAKKVELQKRELEDRINNEKIDVTLPGRESITGHLHPLTLTEKRIKNIFLSMGFTVEEGPEIEQDYFNFEALNLPKDHPARDMQDSFYITDEILMRSQTSPVQARTMQSHDPNSPIRMIAPGRVYRRDDYDATHSPMFTQVEGLVIDKGITFGDLKGTLESFLQQIFNISCVMCHGKGCNVCKGTGWLEILGAGMVHPHVLEMSGYDPKKVSGYAFGMGVERIAMLSYGISDLRLLYDNDVRFIRQFEGLHH